MTTPQNAASTPLLAHLRESIETAQHTLRHARDGAKDNVDVITARGFLSMALDAIYSEEDSQTASQLHEEEAL